MKEFEFPLQEFKDTLLLLKVNILLEYLVFTIPILVCCLHLILFSLRFVCLFTITSFPLDVKILNLEWVSKAAESLYKKVNLVYNNKRSGIYFPLLQP